MADVIVLSSSEEEVCTFESICSVFHFIVFDEWFG